jgi:hypothetical protein
MRSLPLVLAAVLLLGGCNMVTSKRPLFNVADQAGAPMLRMGLWIRPDPACVFDPATPTLSWPECASLVVVHPHWFSGALMGNDYRSIREHPHIGAPYILAGAYPSVLQVRMSDPGKPSAYVFQGLRPSRFDVQGRVIEAKLWLVQCGPPEPPRPGQSDHLYRETKSPLAGLTMDGTDCIANDPQTVLAATRASEGWPQNDGAAAPIIRWVRDVPLGGR